MPNSVIVFVFVALTTIVQGATVSPFDDIVNAATAGQWDKFQKLVNERFGSDGWKEVKPGSVRDLKPPKGGHVYGESEYTFHSAVNDNGRQSETSGGHKIINKDGKVNEFDFKPDTFKPDIKPNLDIKDILKDIDFKSIGLKPEDFKPEDFKLVEFKPEDFKLAGFKPEDFKPVEFKPEDFKPVEFKPEDFKPVDFKPDFKSLGLKPEDFKPQFDFNSQPSFESVSQASKYQSTLKPKTGRNYWSF